MSQKGFSQFLVLLFVAVIGSLIVVSVPKKQPKFEDSIVSKNVLGESQKVVLTPCSGGGLTTAVYKDFQMLYTNESFLRVVNSKDLLKEVSQLKDLTCLQYLDATDQTVKGDITDLKKLVNLEVFSLYSNPDVYGDICALSNATKLRSLKFAFDPKVYGDISCLKDLNKLETFAMTHTQISGDISVFANMSNLKAIYVSGTNIKGDICSLSKLTNLEELGIADEYPGNPDITGDLSCLNGLRNLKRVSIYNTSTTNCEQFTKDHQNLDKFKTESGKQGGGGCSKESMKTLVDYAQKYEKKIGKEVQTEVRGQPNYRPGSLGGKPQEFRGQPNVFQRLVIWLFGLFGKTPPGSPVSDIQNDSERSKGYRDNENPNEIRPQAGPGGCKTQNECDAYCNKPENQKECAKFAPPGEEK